METEILDLDIEQLRLLLRGLDTYEKSLEKGGAGTPIQEAILEIQVLRREIYQVLTKWE